MKSSFEAARKHAATRGSGVFFTLQNDGDKAVVAFCGDIHTWDVVKVDGKFNVPFELGNPKHDGLDVRFRAGINVYLPVERKMQIWEFGAKVFKVLDSVHSKYGFSKKLFEIERHGAKGDQETYYSVLPDADIDEEIAEQIGLAKLHDLSNKGEKAIHTEPASTDDDIPF